MSGARHGYEVHYTEQAAAERDALDARLRARFDKGVDVLARDPYLPASRAVSATGDDRTVRLTEHIFAEYIVSRGRLLIFVVDVFSDQDVLVPEEGSDL
ncbi:type II toxin-antitoxin system RelE/ParE family toxin [Streptomyces sp. NPDC096132]|uniref:type II toxin-antitoxin system RelE family toxin n=1 Tax=Streptomyces sp. NPDC096132 TaxID=3366075 RepID=UPI0038141A6B